MQKFGSYLFKLVLGLFVATLVLSLVEAACRWVYGPPSAPVQVHSGLGRPDTWFSLRNGWVHANYQHQNTGDFAPVSTTKRLAVFGGSSVHGGSMNVRKEQEFSALLGKQLGLKVHNLGNPSLDSHDILSIIKSVASYRMDAWIVYSGHNDFGNTYFHQRYKGWKGGVTARLQGVFEKLQLYWQLRRRAGFVQGNTDKPNPRRQFSGPKIDRHQKARALRYFILNIERITWEARQANIPLILVVPACSLIRAPVGDCIADEDCGVTLYDEAMEKMQENPSYAATLLRKAADADTIPLRVMSSAQNSLRKLAPKSGLTIVDAPRLLPQDTELPITARSLFQDHVHFTPQGHQEMANLLSPVVREVLTAAQ